MAFEIKINRTNVEHGSFELTKDMIIKLLAQNGSSIPPDASMTVAAATGVAEISDASPVLVSWIKELK